MELVGWKLGNKLLSEVMHDRMFFLILSRRIFQLAKIETSFDIWLRLHLVWVNAIFDIGPSEI